MNMYSYIENIFRNIKEKLSQKEMINKIQQIRSIFD